MTDTPTLKDLHKSMQVLINSVTALTSKVEAVESKIDKMEMLHKNVENITQEMCKIKETVNRVEQDSRACVVRVSGLTVSDADMKLHGFEKSIIKKVYDRIVKPVLSVAKTNGDLDSVPTMLNVLEQGYIVSRGGKDKQGRAMPPVLAVRFTNRFLRNTVMRLRREHMPSPSDAEKAAGVSRYYINEDLTAETARKVKELRESALVERVWTIDGRIRLTKVGDPNTIIKVNSPFVSLEEALNIK
jgi:endonuclease V-like protein UPF0215 family